MSLPTRLGLNYSLIIFSHISKFSIAFFLNSFGIAGINVLGGGF